MPRKHKKNVYCMLVTGFVEDVKTTTFIEVPEGTSKEDFSQIMEKSLVKQAKKNAKNALL